MKFEKYKKARTMRKAGMSVRDIALKLGVSKSTVTIWCKNINLSAIQKDKLKIHQKQRSLSSLGKYRQKIRTEKEARVLLHRKNGQEDVGEVTERDLFITGLALYWGEGYKKSRGEVGFTNSDPSIIQVILVWFMKLYKIEKKDFILRVSINNLHTERNKEVMDYWSKITGIPFSQFTKTSFIKTAQKKVYANPEKHFGTLRVKVRRGTNLLERIRGAITELGVQIAK